jgi:hypothetical protein
MVRAARSLASCIIATASLMAAQTVGSISGDVTSENGTVVRHAKVCTSITSKQSTTIGCNTLVDDEGHFQIENLDFGRYGIFAINEEEGYSIDNQSPGLQIEVSPKNPSPHVSVRLRPKGTVFMGSVTDKTNGNAIDNAWIEYVSLDNGNAGSRRTVGGRFSVVVPTDSALLIYVVATGYKGWVYADSSNLTQPTVMFAPGERRVVDIELEPTPKTSAVR